MVVKFHPARCPITKKNHIFNAVTNQCQCGKWKRGFAPKKESTKPRAECQICGREQATDKNGLLLHHGYKRPGWGFIQGDCFGVGFKPYNDTQALEKYDLKLKDYLEVVNEKIKELPRIQSISYVYHLNFGKQKKIIQVQRGAESSTIKEEGVHVPIYVPSFDRLFIRESQELQTEKEQINKEIERVNQRIEKAKELTDKEIKFAEH